jgi:hypothetical protein
MIDLDQPPPAPSAGRRRRRLATVRTLVLAVVGAFLAGGAVGGVAASGWYRSAEQAERSEVSVLLFAEPGVSALNVELRQIRIETQVTVVNAGPETVNVLAVRVDQPGVTVRSPEKERQIEPATAVPVDVVVEWNCTADQPNALVAAVSVETVDEQLRELSPVDLHDTSWIATWRGACAGMG